MSEDPTPAGDSLPVTPASGGESIPNQNGAPAGSWARVVELEREVRFLSAKCDELRHSCRDLLAAINPPAPLTDEQVRSIQSDPPTRSREEVYAEYWRLHKEAAAELPAPRTGDSASRIADLERQVAALRSRRAELRPLFLSLFDAVDPLPPLTEKEAEEMIRSAKSNPGPSIGEIIAEIEREVRP